LELCEVAEELLLELSELLELPSEAELEVFVDAVELCSLDEWWLDELFVDPSGVAPSAPASPVSVLVAEPPHPTRHPSTSVPSATTVRDRRGVTTSFVSIM